MPKAILDVPLRHENFVVDIGFGKGMNYSAESLTELIQGSSRRHFYCGVIDRIKETAIPKAKAER